MISSYISLGIQKYNHHHYDIKQWNRIDRTDDACNNNINYKIFTHILLNINSMACHFV